MDAVGAIVAPLAAIRHSTRDHGRMVATPADPSKIVSGLLRDIGATLRPLGFQGSGGVWRLVGPWGVAVVERQASRASTAREKVFSLDTAVVPQVWWDWTHRSAPAPIEQARESSGLRLLEQRVPATNLAHTNGTLTAWRIDATTDVEALRADLLDQVHDAGERLSELLIPGRYLKELTAVADKQVGHWQALVVLLADLGPSAALDDACAGARSAFAARPAASLFVEELITWAHARATG